MAEKRVCVIGAGGYLASWLVKLLLSEGFYVHGTVRDPGNDKNSCLRNLENTDAKLTLFKADLLDYDSIHAAVKGCDGVFHVASPTPSGVVSNLEVEVVAPALEGTLNVLKASSEEKVRRVVVVSSVVAMAMNPNLSRDQLIDETCWSDKEFCRTTNSWYHYSKTVSEIEAWEYAKKTGLDIVTVCPTLIIGPSLQQTSNASYVHLLKLLKEGYEQMDNRVWTIVDVRDVATALKLAFELPEAEGRYLCMSHMIKAQDLTEILKRTYPNYNYPKGFKDGNETKFSSKKLQNLGWTFRPLEETLVDSVESCKKVGLLD